MKDLSASLIDAWHRAAYEASQDLGRAASAPGLFTPEFIEKRLADLRHAQEQLDRTIEVLG